MKYNHKKLDKKTYLSELYKDGLQKSNILDDNQVESFISMVGIFKFKGYVKAFRDKLSLYCMDDIISLYKIDRKLSSKMFSLSSQIEIKLKTYLVEIVYELTDNPFVYLCHDSYCETFGLSNDILYDWEVKETHKVFRSELYMHYRDYYLSRYTFESNKVAYLKDRELIELSNNNINYPPFHYLIESLTLGSLINIISKMEINGNKVLKLVANRFGIYQPDVFIAYLLRLKELRNRCAHNGRIFNRNYRSVKAIGKYKKVRKNIYNHRLLDVYYTLCFLLNDVKTIEDSSKLENQFISQYFKSTDKKMINFILDCMRKRQVCMQGLTVSDVIVSDKS